MLRLSGMETLSSDDFIRGGSHSVSVARLAPEAQRRLARIGKDDVDELVSFRISARKRVWCIAVGNLMKVLWWDPNHEVAPSTKRRT